MHASDPAEDPELQGLLAPLINYMHERSLGRVDLSIEALDAEFESASSGIAVVEAVALTDYETPSSDGLDGAFVLFETETGTSSGG